MIFSIFLNIAQPVQCNNSWHLSDLLPGLEEDAELKWGHLKFLALTPTL